MTLGFDQSVKTLPNGIRVYDATGTLVSGVAHSGRDPRAVEVTLQRLPKGAYTVRWSAISNDSHVGHGVFTFGVRVKAPALAEAFGASGPTTSEHVVRWLYFLCLALLTGGLGFRLFVLRGDVTPEAERRFYRLDRRGRHRGARGRDRRVPAARRRTRSSCRSRRSCTATSRRSRTTRASARRSSRWSSGSRSSPRCSSSPG